MPGKDLLNRGGGGRREEASDAVQGTALVMGLSCLLPRTFHLHPEGLGDVCVPWWVSNSRVNWVCHRHNWVRQATQLLGLTSDPSSSSEGLAPPAGDFGLPLAFAGLYR